LILDVTGTVTFKAVEGDKTEVSFEMVMETTAQFRQLSEEGWVESFDRLAAILTTS